jgi:hypothetical protein
LASSLCSTARPTSRAIIDIEKAAKLTVRENSSRGPHFAKWKPFDPDDVHAPTAETVEAGMVIPTELDEAVAA